MKNNDGYVHPQKHVFHSYNELINAYMLRVLFGTFLYNRFINIFGINIKYLTRLCSVHSGDNNLLYIIPYSLSDKSDDNYCYNTSMKSMF